MHPIISSIMEIQLPRCRYSAQQHKPVLLPVWPTFTLASWKAWTHVEKWKPTTTTAAASFCYTGILSCLPTGCAIKKKKCCPDTFYPAGQRVYNFWHQPGAARLSYAHTTCGSEPAVCLKLVWGMHLHFWVLRNPSTLKVKGKNAKKQPCSSLLAASRLALCLHICRLSPRSIPSSRLCWRLIVTCWRRRDSPHRQPPVGHSSELVGKKELH